MKEITVPMALLDYIPVILHFFAASTISQDLRKPMGSGKHTIFKIGSALVFISGFLNASYKLIYSLDVGDYPLLSDLFFPCQALGFLLMGISLLLTVFKKDETELASFLPVMLMAGIMAVGVALSNVSLAALSKKYEKKSAIVYFIVSLVACLVTCFLLTMSFRNSFMNYVAEGIDILGQGMLLAGAKSLHKSIRKIK